MYIYINYIVHILFNHVFFLHLDNVNPYSAGIDFSRQNLTSVDIFVMAVDPYHTYSNESERPN